VTKIRPMCIRCVYDHAALSAGVGVDHRVLNAINCLHRGTSCGDRSFRETTLDNSVSEKESTSLSVTRRSPRECGGMGYKFRTYPIDVGSPEKVHRYLRIPSTFLPIVFLQSTPIPVLFHSFDQFGHRSVIPDYRIYLETGLDQSTNFKSQTLLKATVTTQEPHSPQEEWGSDFESESPSAITKHCSGPPPPSPGDNSFESVAPRPAGS
jgi:hypothetical protein